MDTTLKTEITAKLAAQKAFLRERFGVTALALFGSYARGEATAESDVDILVTFSRIPGFDFFRLEEYLEDLLGKRVDIVTADGVKRNRLPYIEKDIINV